MFRGNRSFQRSPRAFPPWCRRCLTMRTGRTPASDPDSQRGIPEEKPWNHVHSECRGQKPVHLSKVGGFP